MRIGPDNTFLEKQIEVSITDSISYTHAFQIARMNNGSDFFSVNSLHHRNILLNMKVLRDLKIEQTLQGFANTVSVFFLNPKIEFGVGTLITARRFRTQDQDPIPMRRNRQRPAYLPVDADGIVVDYPGLAQRRRS